MTPLGNDTPLIGLCLIVFCFAPAVGITYLIARDMVTDFNKWRFKRRWGRWHG